MNKGIDLFTATEEHLLSLFNDLEAELGHQPDKDMEQLFHKVDNLIGWIQATKGKREAKPAAELELLYGPGGEDDPGCDLDAYNRGF